MSRIRKGGVFSRRLSSAVLDSNAMTLDGRVQGARCIAVTHRLQCRGVARVGQGAIPPWNA